MLSFIMDQSTMTSEIESEIFSSRSQSQDGEASKWHIFGSRIPKKEIVFFCQIIMLYIIVIASIINLSVGNLQHNELWVILLSTSTGCIMPAPKLKKYKPVENESLQKLNESSNL